MTGKTLKELNVQVGDVVQSLVTGHEYTLGADWENEYNNWVPFEVISRATKYTDWKFGTAPDGADTHAMPDGTVAWRVKVEPKVESVTKYRRADNGGWTSSQSCTKTTHKMTYNEIDGIPDCASVKMELLT